MMRRYALELTLLAFVLIVAITCTIVVAQLGLSCNPGPRPVGVSAAQWAGESVHVCQ